MKRFTNDIIDIKRGTTDINKVYRGENLVWERSSLSTSFELLFDTTLDDGDDVVIPLFGTGYDFTIDWGDNTIEQKDDANLNTVANQPTYLSHVYSTPGEYTVKISVNAGIGFPRIYYNKPEFWWPNDGKPRKLINILNWGNIIWSTMTSAFSGCVNTVISATDAPDLSVATSLRSIFTSCLSLTTESFTNWDVSNITDMRQVFRFITNFNGDVTNWDVRNVFQFDDIFAGCQAFNQDISSWGPFRQGSALIAMFASSQFNQDISGWDVSGVVNMAFMFIGNNAFNQDISGWCVENIPSEPSNFGANNLIPEFRPNWGAPC